MIFITATFRIRPEDAHDWSLLGEMAVGHGSAATR